MRIDKNWFEFHSFINYFYPQEKKTYDKLFSLFCFLWTSEHTHTRIQEKRRIISRTKKKRETGIAPVTNRKKREKNTQQTRSYSTLVLFLFE